MTKADAAGLSEAKQALLAERLKGRSASLQSSLPVRHRADGSHIPLSVDQEALWYFSKLAPTSPLYNELITVRKDGPFDADVFRRAFNEFVRRHEAWRTTFSIAGGEPEQVVNPPTAFDIPLVDLSHLPPDDAERRAAELAGELAKRPYDLEHGPLLRPKLFRFADDHHRLYLGLHHVVFDGVTVYRVLLPELVALYDAFAEGQPSPLPEPTVQYGDYAMWEREWVSGPVVERRMEYWRAHLGGVQSLALPLDHTRPQVQRFHGQVQEINVGLELAQALRSLAKETGVTLFHVLTTAFGVLLSRYSNQTDVAFGTVADLRQRPELHLLAGLSLTPLVLRLDLGDDPSVGELLTRTRSEMLDALDNLVPFWTIVRETHPQRVQGSNPLFQAMITLEPPMASPDPSWSAHQMDVEIGNAIAPAKVDLVLDFDERPDGHISGMLIFDTDIIEPDTARRMAGHLRNVLHAMAADATQTVSALPLLTEEERRRTLVEWNDTQADYPDETCVHELVASRADHDPHSVAVIFEDESLTFAELNGRANAVAHRLSAVGARPGTVVAFHAERSLEMIVGLLGIMKTGAAILPLDPSYPASRLAFMMEDCGVGILMTDGRVTGSLPSDQIGVLTLELGSTLETREEPPPVAASAGDAMYVVYTSGSTGKPKAVSLRHCSVVNLLTAAAREFEIGPGQTVGAVASFSFDMSVLDFWLPLVTGARLCVVPREAVLDARRLNRLVTEADITFMQATPSTWQMLVDAGWTGSADVVVVSSGEPLTPQLAKCLRSRCAALWNPCGPTETTVWATLGRVEDDGPITIGKPLANSRVYILDDRREPVPIGVPGEIVIGGTGVTDGYLNRPEETSRRFIPDPFVPGGRVYRSGDLARFLPDGRIEHLGRTDQQIKHHGYRIEPAEIEGALKKQPNVAAAVVVKWDQAPGRSLLVAYLVPRGPLPADSELRHMLRTTLPEYMVPSTFVILDRIPYTVNGKLDRLSLPTPSVTGLGMSGSAPPSELEARLLSIWRAMLGVDEVGLEDDFFEMGGDSLMAWRLVAAAGDSLGMDLPLTVLFERGATPRGMASAVRAHERASTDAPCADARVEPESGALMLFCVVPHENAGVALRHIFESVRDDCEVVGLLSGMLGKPYDRSVTVESLAEEVLAEIRLRQPRGPYLIAGFSLGGLVAYEVARRIRAEGEVVAWLGLLDTGEPGMSGRGSRVRSPLAQSHRHLARRVMLRSRIWLHRQLAWIHPFPFPSDEFDFVGAKAIALRYSVVGHDAPLDVFTSESSAAAYGRSAGWERVHQGKLGVHSLPGNHNAVLKAPQAEVIAEVLSARLEQIRAQELDIATI